MNQIVQQIKSGIVPDGYKKTEAGSIPCDWSCAKLSEIADPITQTAGNETYETVSISAGIGFVNQAEKFGREISGEQYKKYTVLHKGDFAYNKGNSGKYPQGCIYRLKDRETAAVPNVFESFRIKTGCAEYYDQLFTSGFRNHQLYRLINHGVRDDGLLNLTQEDFYCCVLPVPPIYEQMKIAAILDQYDQSIQLLEEKTEALKMLKGTCLRKVFPQKNSSIPELRFPGFSDDWEQRRLEEITTKIGSGKTPLGGSKSYSDSGIPLIRSQNINNNRVDLSDVVFIDQTTDTSMENSRVFTGDILLNITGASIGRSAVYKKLTFANVNQHVCIIRPQNGYLSDFIQLHLVSVNGQKQIALNQAGSGRDVINYQQISNMHFLFPSEKEQTRITMFFNSFDKIIALHQRQCNEEKRNKKALTQILLTGIARVSE